MKNLKANKKNKKKYKKIINEIFKGKKNCSDN
jgi:hypothetical protein